MKWLKDNLLVQFSVVGFIVMAILAIALAAVLSNSIRSNTIGSTVDEAIADVSGRLLSVITPVDLEAPMIGEKYATFHSFIQDTIVSDRVARVKLWAKDGTVIYSNDPASVGGKFPDNENLLKALQGENTAQIKIPDDPENERERFLGTLIEVYTPVVFPGTSEPRGVLEIYLYYLPTAQLITNLQRTVWFLTIPGFIIIYGALVTIVWRGWRTILRQRKEREDAEKEKREIQQQLILNDRLVSIGQMTSGVAHELNNPLSSIIGFSDLLLEKELPKEIKEELAIINTEAKRSIAIAKGLLNFSRRQGPQNSVLNINNIIQEVLHLRAYEHKLNNIQVKTGLTDDLPEITGNTIKLQQVFINIIVNAEQAMLEVKKNGILTITTEHIRNAVRASVRDDGPGITPENMKSLFTAFFWELYT